MSLSISRSLSLWYINIEAYFIHIYTSLTSFDTFTHATYLIGTNQGYIHKQAVHVHAINAVYVYIYIKLCVYVYVQSHVRCM